MVLQRLQNGFAKVCKITRQDKLHEKVMATISLSLSLIFNKKEGRRERETVRVRVEGGREIETNQFWPFAKF